MILQWGMRGHMEEGNLLRRVITCGQGLSQDGCGREGPANRGSGKECHLLGQWRLDVRSKGVQLLLVQRPGLSLQDLLIRKRLLGR